MSNIKYKFLAHAEITSVWRKIVGAATVDTDARYWIGKWHKKLTSSTTQMAKDFHTRIAEKFGEKDESGKFKAPQEPVEGYWFENGIMIAESKREEYRAALEAFSETEVETELPLLKRKFLSGVALTPLEELVIEDILQPVEAQFGAPIGQIAKLVDNH